MKDAIKREQSDACINSAEVTEQREQCELAQTLPSRDGTRCNHREHARPQVNVKDIFALRKQGKIEEAYDAIRPIYREHKGKFTTLCMFWVASDVFKLRLEQKRVEEAEKIYEALKRMLPHVQKIEDEEQAAGKQEGSPAKEQTHHKGQARGFMKFAEGRLIKASEKFRKRYFAMRDKKKHQTAENEGINIPSDNPSKPVVIPSEPLNKGQQAVMDAVKALPGLRVPGLETETGIPAKSIERHIKVLIERNLIEHRGSKKTGGYHALN